MENAAKQIRKQPRRDRVTLDPVSLSRLQEWIETLHQQFQGLKVTRNSLVNFLIQHHSPLLSANELTTIKNLHFDEVEFASWALNEIKKARASGEKLSLSDVIAKTKASSPRKHAPRPKKTLPIVAHLTTSDNSPQNRS